MKIQRQKTDRRGDKTYYKYVVVIPEETLKQAGLKEGDELKAEVKKGEVKLKKEFT